MTRYQMEWRTHIKQDILARCRKFILGCGAYIFFANILMPPNLLVLFTQSVRVFIVPPCLREGVWDHYSFRRRGGLLPDKTHSEGPLAKISNALMWTETENSFSGYKNSLFPLSEMHALNCTPINISYGVFERGYQLMFCQGRLMYGRIIQGEW